MKDKKYSIYSLIIIFLLFSGFYFLYKSGTQEKNYGFKLGLDLSGGTQLLYKADVSNLKQADIKNSLESLKDTIERRVNAFGVAEPIVQLEEGSALDKDAKYRLIVELPGVTDTQKAIEALGKTPVLEFRLQSDDFSYEDVKNALEKNDKEKLNSLFKKAEITGAHLERARVQMAQGVRDALSGPMVVITFNPEGKELFANLTKNNVGKVFGIFLDGELISYPVIREAITQGTAVISGNFDADEARELTRNLNFGALPVPISLLSTQSIGASLGHDALLKGVKAAVIGLALVALFMILWYRLAGLVSVVALAVYILILLFIFKYLPVTLTAAGIAGFILSLGMAVDANILIFERMKEELLNGKPLKESIKQGFLRAWSSIRDGNLSSLITAIILFWFGSSLIKGFALVFAIGILVSMFSAIFISKTLLLALNENIHNRKLALRLFKSGIK